MNSSSRRTRTCKAGKNNEECKEEVILPHMSLLESVVHTFRIRPDVSTFVIALQKKYKNETAPHLTIPSLRGWLRGSWRYHTQFSTPDCKTEFQIQESQSHQVHWVPSDTSQFVTWGSELRHYQVSYSCGGSVESLQSHDILPHSETFPWQCA